MSLSKLFSSIVMHGITLVSFYFALLALAVFLGLAHFP